MPGRGRRAAEPFLESLDALAADVVEQVRGQLNGQPYALYGHSMGGLIAYLAAQKLRAAQQPQPIALFVSGCDAPSALRERHRHTLPPAEFTAMLEEMGGCPPQVLADRELLAFFEPILRADFKAVETWAWTPRPPLPIPIVTMIGDADDVTRESAEPWARETNASWRLHAFSGGHFFILDHWPAIASLMQAELERARAAT